MPFPMKVQPIDSSTYRESIKNDTVKPLLKSRLKRFFDRPFPSVLRISSAAEKPGAANDGATAEFEPNSVCLDKLVQNFIEENNDKPSAARFGRKCNCFNGNNNDSSDDEFDLSTGFSDSVTNSSFGDSSDTLKSLIPCASVTERNLLAETSKIVDENKSCKRKDDLRKIVTDELLALGYKASICKSKWEKASSTPAGEYEYIDVSTVEGERVILDIDFRSEFEIARSTGKYKAVLQLLPFIFVGKADRLLQIVSIVSEAARQSLKKKGMHIAPWRNPEYMKAKWLSPYTRITPAEESNTAAEITESASESENGELDLIFADKTLPLDSDLINTTKSSSSETSGEEEKPVIMTWQPPAVKPKSCDRKTKVVVTGLAFLLREKP
ncbi:uncharacterized protein LOC129900591 [Solanum dulcamara]|uniref:uncharacterized protein LOC129900591 n=1 Tax=Solanum dulcamara TaxID=45834 RepID=UPI002485698C|nr:uncharacterized protein LOC129900591 [Solanum dulcamara]